MKLKIFAFILLLINAHKLFSQTTIASNAITAVHFLGSSTNVDLNFRTFNNPRFRILTGGLTGNGATTDGFVGLGNFSTFTPNNLLHQHLNFNRSNYTQFTNLNTGNTATEAILNS